MLLKCYVDKQSVNLPWIHFEEDTGQKKTLREKNHCFNYCTYFLCHYKCAWCVPVKWHSQIC